LEKFTEEQESLVDRWEERFRKYFEDIDWEKGGRTIGLGIAQGVGDSFQEWMHSQFGDERSDLAKTVADALYKFASWLLRFTLDTLIPAFVFNIGLIREVAVNLFRNLIQGVKELDWFSIGTDIMWVSFVVYGVSRSICGGSCAESQRTPCRSPGQFLALVLLAANSIGSVKRWCEAWQRASGQWDNFPHYKWVAWL